MLRLHVYELIFLLGGGRVGGGVTPGRNGYQARDHCLRSLQPTNKLGHFNDYWGSLW